MNKNGKDICLPLPPYLKGSCRGRLNLIFLEIVWLKRVYKEVLLQVLWWGDDVNSAAILKIITEKSPINSSPNEIVYDIRTNSKLFHSYLKNAEPIEVKLSSAKTKLHIGTAYLPIPDILLRSTTKSVTTCEQFGQIFNLNNQIIGKIKLKFKISFKVKNNEPIVKSVEQYSNKFFEKENKMVVQSTKAPEFEFDSKSLLSRCSQQSTRTFNDLHNFDRTNILNYLTSEVMSRRQESQALSEIRSISPPESLVEALTYPIINYTRNYHNELNCVYIKIACITLNAIGRRQCIKDFQRKDIAYTFSVHMKLPGKRFVHILSESTRQLEQIYFKNKADCEISASEISQKYFIAAVTYFISTSKTQPINFGFAKVNIAEVINSQILSQKLPIYNDENNIIMGHIVLDFAVDKPLNRSGNPLLQPILCNHDEGTGVDSVKSNGNHSRNGESAKLDANNLDKTKNYNLESNGKDKEMVKIDMQGYRDKHVIKFLEGLIYIGNIEKVDTRDQSSYFVVLHTFWKGTECTQITGSNTFNYLELFSIICNNEFLDRMKNNFLVLELWQKNQESTEKLVGNILLPLHKFYVALSDANGFDQLRLAKFPIISIDGWVPITTPLSNGIFGQIEIVLAIGTKEQIDGFKILRNLSGVSINLQITPEIPTNNLDRRRAVEIQANLKSPKAVAVDKLNAFIESLAQLRTPKMVEIENPLQKPQQIRKTSELLDMLQIALSKAPQAQTPPVSISPVPSPQTMPPLSPVKENEMPSSHLFKATIEIQQALNLPKSISRHQSAKKSGGTKRGKGKYNRNSIEMEPSTYVTFQAFGAGNNLLKSHEGPVYSTSIAEKTCNPVWNKKFDVMFPVEYLNDSNKQFEIKVLNKYVTDQIQCRLTPTPSDDIIIGASKIDLTPLLNGVSEIDRYFNVVDFSGRVNGQIKLKITPMQQLSQYRDMKLTEKIPSPIIDPLFDPTLSLLDATGFSCSFLSGALKRKFTELEEITQRLKSRLQDVTNEDNNDIDDEFANDLNTEVDEEDNEKDWPNFDPSDSDEYNPCFDMWKTNDGSSSSNTLPSTSTATIATQEQERVKMISDTMQKASIDDE